MNVRQIGQFPWVGAAMLAGVVYAITLGGTYIYDDHGIIREDLRIADASRWMEFITGPYSDGVDRLYRPLVSLSYAVEWKLHGDRAWVFHLVNLLLHMGVSALVAELGRRLLGLAGGWISGLIFAVHPVHVEAVANIVGRAELMCALGMLGAMVLILKPLTFPRALGIVGCFVVSLLSKEQGMLIPALLLGLWWAVPRASDESRRARLTLLMLICWIAAGYLLWRDMRFGFWWNRELLDWTINPMVTGELNPHGGSIGADRWLMPLVLLGRYIELLVAPVRLMFDYSGMVIGWRAKLSDPYLWIGVAGAVGWCVAMGVAWWKSSRVAMFLLVGLAMMYGLVGNVVALIGVIFAERLMYVPSIFFILLIVMLLRMLPPRGTLVAVVMLVALGSVRTFSYAELWNNEVKFYESMLARQPQSIRLHTMLIDAHRKAGRLAEAEVMAARGRELLPEYWDIWFQSGVIALEQERFDEAQRFFKRSFELNRDPKVVAWIGKLTKLRAAAASRPSL